MTETADIIVIGGGCIGASIALHLAEKKAGKILLLEKKELANGASGKGIGIIRTHYTHPVLAGLARRSLELFHNFKDRFGGYDGGFYPCGYFVLVGEPDVTTLEDVVAMHQKIGIQSQRVDPQVPLSRMPQLNIRDVAAVAYEPKSGYGIPPQTTTALAQRAAELGVEVRTQTPVLEIQLDQAGIQGVMTPTGPVATRTVIDCVGPWAKRFTEHLGLEFPVTPIVEHVVVVDRGRHDTYPYTEVAQPHPVISDLVNLCYFRSDPQHPYTRIGNSDPTYHAKFALENADQFQGQLFPGICQELRRKLNHRWPLLEGSPGIETYSGIWGVTPDYQPILDHLSHIPGLYCAVGFSGHGYKLSPIIGDSMSRFILGETHPLVDTLKLFRFSRFQTNDLIRAPFSYTKAQGLR